MAQIEIERPMTGINVQPLRDQVRDRILDAGDGGYNEARAVHNGMFDKRPLAVLRAEQVADVIAGVNFAREDGLELAIRDGGHSAPGFGTCDGGLVIDMSGMRTVRVDPKSKTSTWRTYRLGRYWDESPQHQRQNLRWRLRGHWHQNSG
jgi:FAD binding domain